jgi:hypothetical protein
MKKNWLWIIGLLVFLGTAESKILIITHAYNRPEFIDYHCRTFQKFLQDDYEYVVFNDASSPDMYHLIHQVCARWGVQCIDIPQEIHDHPQLSVFEDPNWKGSLRHTDNILFSLEQIGYQHNGIVALVDSDLFFIRPLSIVKLMQNRDIVSVMRHAWDGSPEVTHLWPGLTFLSMNRLPNKEKLNFRVGVINGHIVDSGGQTYYYLKEQNVDVRSLGIHTDHPVVWPYKNASVGTKKLSYVRAGLTHTQVRWLLRHPEPDIELFHRGHFVHLKAGRIPVDARTSILTELLEDVLAQ